MPTAGSQQPSGALAARLSGTVAGNFTLVYLLIVHPTTAVCEYIFTNKLVKTKCQYFSQGPKTRGFVHHVTVFLVISRCNIENVLKRCR